MGKGIDLAGLTSPAHAAMIDDLKDQLLIVFLKRMGGRADITVAEVDATGDVNFAFSVDMDTRTFHFEVRPKERGS
jgi:hypothetical protein